MLSNIKSKLRNEGRSLLKDHPTLQRLLPISRTNSSSAPDIPTLDPSAAEKAIQASKQHNSQHCLVASLPQELIDCIADVLPSLERATLAITCCALYTKLRDRLDEPAFRQPVEIETILGIMNDEEPSPYVLLRYLENERWKYCTKCFTLHPREDFEEVKKKNHGQGQGQEENENGDGLKDYCKTPGLVSICPGWSISYRQARRLVQEIRSSRRCILKGLKGKEEDGGTRLAMMNNVPWREYLFKWDRETRAMGEPAGFMDLFVTVHAGLRRGRLCFVVMYYARSWQLGPWAMATILPMCAHSSMGVAYDWPIYRETVHRKLSGGRCEYSCFKVRDVGSVQVDEGEEEWVVIRKIVGRIGKRPDKSWTRQFTQWNNRR